MHEAGAFVDFADLGVAVEFFYGVVLYESGAAEDGAHGKRGLDDFSDQVDEVLLSILGAEISPELIPVKEGETLLGVVSFHDVAKAVNAVEDELGDSGRVLLRPSGTEQLIRVMVEAPTQEQADAVAARLAEVVAAVG